MPTPDSAPEEPTPAKDGFPRADVRPTRDSALRKLAPVLRRYWWAPSAAAVLAVALAAVSWWSQGPVVRVHFDQGHGIKAGDAVLYRGIEVGRVEAVQLDDDDGGIHLDVRLAREARHVAREGTQFWIERPQVSLARVRGLETVVGAKYVAVLPGPEGGALRREFTGSETPIWLDDAGQSELIVDFRAGQGLAVGDPLRYRGMDVGEVMDVGLSDDLQTVRVRIRLTQSAAHVARSGGQFWIERPAVSLAGVQGLETIVGGRYVAVIPGPEGGETQRHFVGLDEPPAARDRAPDGLEIVLTSSHRRGLTRGAPVTYRGLPIGRVISVGLASDALTVEARVYVRPEYKHLVRQGSKFWNTGGVELNAGVSGLQLRLDSVESLLSGGVAMATPEELGDAAATGSRFEFFDEPEDEWIEWKPQIPVGVALLPSGGPLPAPRRAQLRFEGRGLVFRRTRRVLGWVLPLDSNRLLGPADVLAPSEDERETAVLEIEGREHPLSGADVTAIGGVGLAGFSTKGSPWPIKRIRTPSEPEDCLAVAGDIGTRLPLAAGRLKPAEAGWEIDKSLSFDETDWHGASVVAASDGMLVGLLAVEERTGRVLFIPPELVKP